MDLEFEYEFRIVWISICFCQFSSNFFANRHFYGIIISFSLENGLGFHLDLDFDLLKIVHGLGLGFEILNGFGYMDLDFKLIGFVTKDGFGFNFLYIWTWI